MKRPFPLLLLAGLLFPALASAQFFYTPTSVAVPWRISHVTAGDNTCVDTTTSIYLGVGYSGNGAGADTTAPVTLNNPVPAGSFGGSADTLLLGKVALVADSAATLTVCKVYIEWLPGAGNAASTCQPEAGFLISTFNCGPTSGDRVVTVPIYYSFTNAGTNAASAAFQATGTATGAGNTQATAKDFVGMFQYRFRVRVDTVTGVFKGRVYITYNQGIAGR